MAKARAKKKVTAEIQETYDGLLSPEKVHELFGLAAPYEPPLPPMRLSGFATFWDPGVSVRSLVKQHRALFYLGEFPHQFTGEADSRRWRQINLAAAEPGLTFAEQKKKLKLGEPAAAREVVTFLMLHFLATGERLAVRRLRCREVTESGRRAIVGPFSALGLDIANVSDAWTLPNIGLAEVCVARRK